MSTYPSNRLKRKMLSPLDPLSSERCASSINPWRAEHLRPARATTTTPAPTDKFQPGIDKFCDDSEPTQNG
jgi:hypothetical protein